MDVFHKYEIMIQTSSDWNGGICNPLLFAIANGMILVIDDPSDVVHDYIVISLRFWIRDLSWFPSLVVRSAASFIWSRFLFLLLRKALRKSTQFETLTQLNLIVKASDSKIKKTGENLPDLNSRALVVVRWAFRIRTQWLPLQTMEWIGFRFMHSNRLRKEQSYRLWSSAEHQTWGEASCCNEQRG